MRFNNCFKFFPLLLRGHAWRPDGAGNEGRAAAHRESEAGHPAIVTLKMSLPPGFHANSNKPTESNLIPLTLKWTGGPLQEGVITYPNPSNGKVLVSQPDKPISVVTGAFDAHDEVQSAGHAAPGPAAQTGTLRYQACNDRMCFPPKTVNVNVPSPSSRGTQRCSSRCFSRASRNRSMRSIPDLSTSFTSSMCLLVSLIRWLLIRMPSSPSNVGIAAAAIAIIRI